MNVLAETLKLPAKGILNTYFKLFGSFLISGLIHYGADYTLFHNWSGISVQFFLLQAVAITCEDSVIFLAGRFGANKRTITSTLVGYVWVISWFAFSLPIWLDPIIHAGVMEEAGILKVSLILGIWRGEWMPS